MNNTTNNTSGNYHFALKESDLLPGQCRRVEIDGQALVLINVAGIYHALSDQCPHSGASMAQGWLNEAGHLICPRHDWAFDVKTGHCTHMKNCLLTTYTVSQRDDGIWIKMENKS